jgi:hypothetical protein
MERASGSALSIVTSLMLINTAGLLSVMILVGFAVNKDPILADHLIQTLRHSVRMFVAGAFLPTPAFALYWIRADDLSLHIRRLATWSASAFIVASAVLFLVAGWNLPHSIMRGTVPSQELLSGTGLK